MNDTLDLLKQFVTPENANDFLLNRTVLDIAAEHGNTKQICWLIEECGAKISNALYSAAFHGEIDALLCLLKYSTAKDVVNNVRVVGSLLCYLNEDGEEWYGLETVSKYSEAICRIIELGLNVTLTENENIPLWVHEYEMLIEKRRIATQRATFALYHIMRVNGVPKDLTCAVLRAFYFTNKIKSNWDI